MNFIENEENKKTNADYIVEILYYYMCVLYYMKCHTIT